MNVLLKQHEQEEIEKKYQESELEEMGSYNHSLVQARIARLLMRQITRFLLN